MNYRLLVVRCFKPHFVSTYLDCTYPKKITSFHKKLLPNNRIVSTCRLTTNKQLFTYFWPNTKQITICMYMTGTLNTVGKGEGRRGYSSKCLETEGGESCN
jgi:hypothetical protein